MADEAELIRRSAAGELDAFEELVLLKRDRVFRTAYQVVRNAEDARDVAQLVFVRLWRVIRRYRPERKFDTWLYRITFNLALDQKRKSGPAGRTVSLDAMMERGGGQPNLPASRGPEPGAPTGRGAFAPDAATPEASLDREELNRVY